ncbi:P-loop containing nucleoside triphosphate hydrolase protein [Thozetella sp. PMI_491]|nr:P-loop containing nucleoside triphosphate hydrolase protein [Thozetella sp. PMI_491]
MEIGAFCRVADNSFGPVIPPSCRGGFDFTIRFEQSVLSILPNVLFLLICPLRVTALRRSPCVIRIDASHNIKLAVAGVYAVLQLAILVLWSLPSTLRTDIAIPSAVVSLLSAIVIGAVSHYEHTRSLRPSTLLIAFLNLTTIFDVAIARTLWLSMGEYRLAAIFTALLAVKVSLLLLEARKKSGMRLAGKKLPTEAFSSIYSRSFFWWINPLFFKGLRNILTLEDLDDLEKELSSSVLAPKMSTAWKHHAGRWALLRALLSALKFPLLVPVPARLALTGFSYAQPFLITAAVDYMQRTTNEESNNFGYGLIGATIIVYLGISTSTALYNYKLYRLITMIRGSLISIIFEKTLSIPSVERKSSAALTLMGTDVDRISRTAETAYEIWSGSLETALGLYLLQRQTGWACIAPVLLGIITLIGNSVIGKLIPKRMKQWQQAVQKRVAATSRLLRNMRSLKMMGLSSEMADSLQKTRVSELDLSANFRWLVAFMNLFGIGGLPPLLSPPFTFLIFIYSAQFFTEGGISAARAFTTLSLLELMTAPLAKLLRAIPVFTAAIACLDRIQDYLRLENPAKESISLLSDPEHISPGSQMIDSIPLTTRARKSSGFTGPAVTLDDVSVGYKDKSSVVLKDISLIVDDGDFVMVLGPVGCGKSTLMKTLVGELAIGSGSLGLKYHEIGFCQQEPWLTNSTVRVNIIGPAVGEEDAAWYKTVVSACALDKDIAGWPDGDNTMIGTGGVTCSGGQKQRLALARALYSRKPLLVLDDTLSALDTKTEHFIFTALFSEHGLIKRLKTTVVFATNDTHRLSSADKIIIFNAEGRIDYQGAYDGLKDSMSLAPILGSPAGVNQTGASESQLELKTTQKRTLTPKITQATTSRQEKTRRTGDISSYLTYAQSMGWSRAIFFLFIAIGFAFCSKFSQVWLQWFTGSNSIERGFFIGIYFALVLSTVCLSLAYYWWMMIIIMPVSAGSLHQQLVTSVFRAPLGFFSSVDLGVILNRFGQDMAYATTQLPVSSQNAVITVFVLIAQFALIATGSGYLAATTPFLIFAIWLVQKYYLCTSRQLRLLDLEQKSPLYTSLTETVEGLPTIRSFGWGPEYHRIFLERLDDSQRPVYFLYCIQRWLNLVLDLIVAALATLLVVLATQLRATESGGLLGLAMVSIVGFSQTMGQFIFYYTELETSLGAIARIKEYTTGLLPDDEPLPDTRTFPPADWPSQGRIEFKDITAYYDTVNEPVLRDVAFQVPCGRLVGISGRTGSGKSSLILTVLRLLNPSSGTILIDDIDIATVSGDFLRSKITTVPQDPYFPPDRTVRLSLNGTAGPGYSDRGLIDVLKRVGLLQHLLDANMESLPLSAGQLQLFCLAHALLQQHKRIVLLDEVTSALDYATEDKLRIILREDLRDRTVLMVAHRPEMLRMCDVTVHMEGGRVVDVKIQS